MSLTMSVIVKWMHVAVDAPASCRCSWCELWVQHIICSNFPKDAVPQVLGCQNPRSKVLFFNLRKPSVNTMLYQVVWRSRLQPVLLRGIDDSRSLVRYQKSSSSYSSLRGDSCDIGAEMAVLILSVTEFTEISFVAIDSCSKKPAFKKKL